ncbi:cytochrome c biogenesis protein CcsA [Peptococcus simiae]|uniref:cytochrome c biogenesis protein CcsA n=1 Tax=Peptococcus simiae TaxID=1643805 RepID=UPI00397FFCD0
MINWQHLLMTAPLVLAICTALAGAASAKKTAQTLARVAAVLGFLCSAGILVLRGVQMKHLPLSSGLDFSLWLCAVLFLFTIFLLAKLRMPLVVVLLSIMIAILAAWVLSQNHEVAPMAPALRSPWLSVHVLSAMLSYSVLTVSFVLSLVIATRKVDKNTDRLDDWAYRLVLLGLPLLTVMLVTGSIWAEYAWGSYWSWDWKEVWALVTWLVYALYLHLRVGGWRNKQAAYLNILGFAVVVFTFFGVSYLLPGLHSYL